MLFSRFDIGDDQKSGGDLRIGGRSGDVQAVLEFSGLDGTFEIYPTLEEAVGSFDPTTS